MAKGTNLGQKTSPLPTVTPSETDLAWAAGIVDGEGCIFISAIMRKRDVSMHHQLTLRVTNTSEPMLVRLRELFGGSFVKQSKAHAHYKRKAQWGLYGFRAADCISAIRPYLVGKAAEADVALEMAATMRTAETKNKRGVRYALRLPADVKARRDQLSSDLKALKHLEFSFEECN